MMATLPAQAPTLTEEKAHLERERQWLFTHIFPRSLPPVLEGLQECRELLQHADTTLPLTSRETERLKGLVTRQGSLLVKGDFRIRLPGLSAQRVALNADKAMTLPQVAEVAHLVDISIASCQHALQPDTAKRVVDDLLDNLREASACLKEPKLTETFPLAELPGTRFSPILEEPVAMDLCIRDASLVADVYLLQDRKQSSNVFAKINRLASGSQGGGGEAHHGGFVRFRGRDVRVVEHVRVESQDPALVAVMTKLAALTHSVEQIGLKIAATAS
ncbi:RAVE subunit 2/Rogdi [Protomyces lactucae-debilis]|uniref:RAVE subunit 2/Rogdi n=1 Tax=Protomyces lactucae-debilis TaxID=2754530 RepID=A0A1Y2FM76_PROLT|nr:RAVE subunit 2/Rogdi [Protomyces lactucae-debilis]ORY85029.1 RAVE subunit 2/Rogdi [Protomyces lactucae-debilis]